LEARFIGHSLRQGLPIVGCLHWLLATAGLEHAMACPLIEENLSGNIAVR
jgi:hypothetical protein